MTVYCVSICGYLHCVAAPSWLAVSRHSQTRASPATPHCPSLFSPGTRAPCCFSPHRVIFAVKFRVLTLSSIAPSPVPPPQYQVVAPPLGWPIDNLIISFIALIKTDRTTCIRYYYKFCLWRVVYIIRKGQQFLNFFKYCIYFDYFSIASSSKSLQPGHQNKLKSSKRFEEHWGMWDLHKAWWCNATWGVWSWSKEQRRQQQSSPTQCSAGQHADRGNNDRLCVFLWQRT